LTDSTEEQKYSITICLNGKKNNKRRERERERERRKKKNKGKGEKSKAILVTGSEGQ
jgi:hypothetical protein